MWTSARISIKCFRFLYVERVQRSLWIDKKILFFFLHSPAYDGFVLLTDKKATHLLIRSDQCYDFSRKQTEFFYAKIRSRSQNSANCLR